MNSDLYETLKKNSLFFPLLKGTQSYHTCIMGSAADINTQFDFHT